MAQASPISITTRDGVTRLTIDRAEARNALNDAVMAALTVAILEAQADASTRAIVVTGAGDRAFCAGADLKPDAKTFGFDYARPNTVYADLLRAASHCTLPLVARVNGACMAGGMGILSMCDMAVASEEARFGLPEVKIGLFPMQVAALLQMVLPRTKFAEMCITGEPITAAEALQYNLVNYVVPPAQLDAKVDWLLARIVDKSPTAIRRGKYALRAMQDMTYEQALGYAEVQIGSIVHTEDAAEGLRAFNERRPPAWTGR
ncbi:enoyl-CoA hydratase-related protein [Chelatococcus reniformis]|uniref:Enoyl-CoA hydratase n=1 Tax=Chelatococcus reniformis TaxID=1494448 RepID=A0A916ULZ5_9HYPH|nr:enoyl-CoA hydratase-related protein [Chelatococcus reniformis]GGC77864.1 enoyl-CoA hydratase [Chelatococcus reniformis]